MLRESLITERTLKDGMNIFVYNNYAIWVSKFSHLYFFFFFNIRSLLNLSTSSIFIIFFCGIIPILFFFYMSWYSCYKFLTKIVQEDLIDEELNPSILNEIIPQIFFSLCNFLLIIIPKESLIIFFTFFLLCILYAALFEYENCVSVFLLGFNGIVTLLLFLYKDEYVYAPSLICSGYYLFRRIMQFSKKRFLYHDREEQQTKILLYACTLAFSVLLLKNVNFIGTELCSLILLISFVVYVHAELSLQKMEILYESMEKRFLHVYVSSLQLSGKTPGTLN
ncbi:conserved Plasmodium protein, unknown function [Plasmodium ovale]|uniref:Uncharacterized protein n=1 Tax=Plasmodium ovale TaxID=36330 RepID=A0A1D3KXG6_PLAOA|nr:conserved Plasmodium protein, unknown function [Plasmodium ovale]